MADLLRDDTDFEMLKYTEASDILEAGLDPAILKNKKSVFNPETGTNDILLSMPSGGYTKVGEEGVDINRPGAILLDGMEYGPDTPEYQRYYPTPSPLAMTEAPAMGQPAVTEAAPEVSPQTQIEDVQSYAQQLQEQQGAYSLEDLTAAGYPEDVIAAAGLDVAIAPPQTRTEALTPEEVDKVLAEGGSLFTSDPTLRQQGAQAVEAFAFDLAVEGLRDELAASGMGPRQIEEEIQARTPELMSQAEIASNILFGTKNPLEFGIADFTTAGIMDIQEGYRLFQQSRQGETEGMTGRAIGMGMMLAGVAEATGVGYGAGKLIKKGLQKIQPTLVQMGNNAEQRIAQEGNMLFSNPVGPILDRGLAAAGRLAAPKLEGGLPGRISTRLPTAKAATEDPMSGELIVGLKEMKADPALYQFNVDITKDYPNMKVVEGENTDQTAERFIEHVKDNLLYLHDKVPADTRVRSQKWYDGARAITDNWSKEYGVPDTSIAGVLAALSPQKDWYQNVSLGQRVLDVAIKKRDFKFTPEMEETFRSLPSLNKPKYEPMLELIRGKSYTEIVDEDPAVQATLRAMYVRLYDQTYNKPDYRIVGPEGDFLEIATNADGSPSKAAWGSLNEIGKAVASIDASGDVNTISRLMGERHKVRNFYNNIYDPNSPFGDVTIDTHAVAAGLLRPLSGNSLEVDHNFKNMSIKGRGTTKGSSKTGVSGNYGLYAEAYRRAAAERGILPRQMQSITWEAVRGLFTDKFKQSAKNVADVDAIWQRYKAGEIDLDETRRLVDERAGGINPPTWE